MLAIMYKIMINDKVIFTEDPRYSMVVSKKVLLCSNFHNFVTF